MRSASFEAALHFDDPAAHASRRASENQITPPTATGMPRNVPYALS
jgi:hypothetical protein